MADETALALCTAAMRAIRAVDPRETPDTDDVNDVFEELIRMLDEWSAKGMVVYFRTQDTHALTAGTLSYTIGSGATIDTGRPVNLVDGCYVAANGLDYPLTIIDRTRYNLLTQKGVGADYPNLIYYEPTYPNGTIYLWPPGGGTLHLWSQKVMDEPSDINQNCVFPPGYRSAIKWNLAERISPEFLGDPSAYIVGQATRSLTMLEDLNAANDYPEVELQIDRLNNPNSTYDIDGG